MIPFLLRRLGLGFLTLFIVISLTFIMIRKMPGSPFEKDRKISAEVLKKIEEKYKLNGTLWEQYLSYIKDLFQGDLRLSTKYRNRSVNEILSQTFPISINLGCVAFVLSLSIGITLGSIAAVYHKKFLDQFSMFLAVLSISIPNFVIAPLLTLIFCLKYTLLPVAGWGQLSHWILPSIALALPYAAYVARLTRNSMLDVLSQDFIRTARAKGLHEARIIIQHALKVALLPVVSYAGPLAAYLFTGSLVIEEIFKIPGMGNFFVNSVINRDIFLVGGIVLIYSSLLIFFNILVDILYTFLDRRIRLS